MKRIILSGLLIFCFIGIISAQKKIELDDLFVKGTFSEKTIRGLGQ